MSCTMGTIPAPQEVGMASIRRRDSGLWRARCRDIAGAGDITMTSGG